MELVEDEDMETMVDLYCGNGSDKNATIHLFAELAGMEQNEHVNASDEEHGAQEPWMVAPISYVDSESTMGGIDIDLNITPDVDMVSGEEEDGGDHWDEEVDSDDDPDVDDVPDDIDDEGINASSVGEQMRRILTYNNSGPHMSLIDPDAAYVAEFPEYPEIVHPRGLAVTSDDDELFIGQRFSCKEECVYAIKRYSMNISAGYFDANNGSAASRPDLGGTCVCRTCQGCNGCKPSVGKCECRRFETLHHPCAHVMAACAKVNLDAEQYADDVYTLERTLRVWENEFSVLPDLSTWEVPPMTFEFLLDRGLRRNPMSCPQSSRICNEMDIREKSDGKRCGVCRLSGHSRNKCPNRNFHIGQSSGSDWN
ncbi:hypothetical protein GOBAR_DD02329 [Gossypium barbadense]|nr:hypothetical protein GOBAR_DD02329 [Gossypium barbadense]